MSSDPLATPEHDAFRELVRKFTEEEMRPRAREFDAAGRIDKALFRKMGELGMLGLRYDPSYGGAGLDGQFEALAHAIGTAVSTAFESWLSNQMVLGVMGAGTAAGPPPQLAANWA